VDTQQRRGICIYVSKSCYKGEHSNHTTTPQTMATSVPPCPQHLIIQTTQPQQPVTPQVHQDSSAWENLIHSHHRLHPDKQSQLTPLIFWQSIKCISYLIYLPLQQAYCSDVCHAWVKCLWQQYVSFSSSYAGHTQTWSRCWL
jgi:hypothetical protein